MHNIKKMIEALYSLYLKHPQISIDTRSISKHCIFFALKGENFNANEFAHTALGNGAAYAIVDEEKFVLDERCILVDSVLETLQELARYHRRKIKCPVLAITGSNGKTTSKELLYRVLQQKYKTTATKGNYNNHIGVPLTILSINAQTEFAIIEMGANHKGEIDFLCNIAMPEYGVITNVGKAHLEGFGSLEGVLKAKTELYRYIDKKNGVLFIKDNQNNLLENRAESTKFFTYGSLEKSKYKIRFIEAQPKVVVSYEDKHIKSQLIGDYNFDNIALSIAIGLHFEVDKEHIKKALESYVPTNNRSQIVKTESNTILLDAYNANPMSVEKAILTMSSVEHENKMIILGDMFELGQESKKEHIKIINLCLSHGFANVILVGELFSAVNKTSYKSYRTTKELFAKLNVVQIKDAFILIKGSRGMKLEQLVNNL